ncbi:MAG: argininosuccinate lyase [Phycisphaerales bacterium]|nr:argininosuccinate lyase [Phycisphaerales bacterium]MCI0675010.1 argininosuccinate lyase [Phycisphaerales bacterium]
MTLWGGRFERKSDPLFKRFNDSLPFDHRLVEHDITGSIAWAKALGDAGVLRQEEVKKLATALEELRSEAARNPAAVRDSGDEDVHSWVESRLIAKVGDLGKKLHTGRSRNDQVATDLRLYVRQQIASRIDEVRQVQAALVQLAEREKETVFPGYTHLQRAQPILFSHWCLAYFEMLDRDADRFADAAKRSNQCPLGAGALAGTAYPIDRDKLATDLGFEGGPTANSLDAVSDRDFVIETLSASVLTALHLSRLAEDLIIYATAEFGFIELPDSLTSGSSLMPQKKNPDALELIRGKAGRIVGSLVSLSMTLKGLPLAYNKDLQEDKEPLFDAMENLSLCLNILPPLLIGMNLRRDVTRQAAEGGYSNATDLADHLVEDAGIPFREAHEVTGRIVRQAIARNVSLEELTLKEMQSIAPQVKAGVHARLTIDSALKRRDVMGGTAPGRVNQALARAKSRLQSGKAAALSGSVTVRQARIDDFEPICELVEYWARQGENLPRNREAILEAIADFGVAVVNERVIGCGSLTIYTPQLAEIRSLGVNPEFQGGGAGGKMVRHFVHQAGLLHIPRVFVLTRAPKFFEKLGFKTVDIATLPEKIRKDCNQCPKQQCCDEIAMVHEIEFDAAK